jgi:hypothetical protein
MDEKTKTDRQELDRLISRAEQLQKANGLTHTQFAARYAEFAGSHKSWEYRLVPRDWDNLKLPTWLPRFRKFIAQIDGASSGQEIFETLPIVKHADYLFNRLQTRTNDRRCAMLVGVQGTGKTLALRYVQRANISNTIFLSANETWKDSRMRIATALASAIGATTVASASQTFQNALETLKAAPINILIDEAHEGGVLLMKLVKTIVNETSCRVMMAQYPTAWRRLNNGANDAYAEAQQLLRRTLRPVAQKWIAGIDAEDFKAWCAAVDLKGLAERAEALLPRIRAHGNYSLLADALERAQVVAGDRDADLEPCDVEKQITEMC